MKFKPSPLREIVLFLVILSLGALINNWSSLTLAHFGIILIGALALFGILKKTTRKPWILDNTFTSALILALILHPVQEFSAITLTPLLLSLIAMMALKTFTWKGMPLVNPVAGGLLIAYGLTQLIPNVGDPFVSWWGVNFKGIVSLVLIALWILFGLKRWRKWGIMISFLLAHAVLLIVRGQPLEFLQFTFTDATIYFFVTIMLIEPKTSPIPRNAQIVYGIAAALLYNGLGHLTIPYFELWTIVGANLINQVMKKIRK